MVAPLCASAPAAVKHSLHILLRPFKLAAQWSRSEACGATIEEPQVAGRRRDGTLTAF